MFGAGEGRGLSGCSTRRKTLLVVVLLSVCVRCVAKGFIFPPSRVCVGRKGAGGRATQPTQNQLPQTLLIFLFDARVSLCVLSCFRCGQSFRPAGEAWLEALRSCVVVVFGFFFFAEVGVREMRERTRLCVCVLNRALGLNERSARTVSSKQQRKRNRSQRSGWRKLSVGSFGVSLRHSPDAWLVFLCACVCVCASLLSATFVCRTLVHVRCSLFRCAEIGGFATFCSLSLLLCAALFQKSFEPQTRRENNEPTTPSSEDNHKQLWCPLNI